MENNHFKFGYGVVLIERMMMEELSFFWQEDVFSLFFEKELIKDVVAGYWVLTKEEVSTKLNNENPQIWKIMENEPY